MKRILLLTLTGALAALLFYFAARYIKIYNVATSSMESVIKAGSIVVVLKTQRVKLGDIITYQTPQNTEPVTHRIIKVQNIHGKTFFITKGENNTTEDPYPISQEELIGKVILALPYLGAILKNYTSYKFLSLTFYAPLGFLFGRNIKKLFKLAQTM